MKDKWGEDDKVLRRVWKVVETKIGKTGVAEVEKWQVQFILEHESP